MNDATYSGRFSRLLYRTMLGARYLGAKRTSKTFVADQRHDGIRRIYVINLDRQADRWGQMRRELQNLHDRSGKPLTAIARRFSAVDARYFKRPSSEEAIHPWYSLADFLFVEPKSELAADRITPAHRIEMTHQEIAVALSHIALWKLIAASDHCYTLVLEDDVYFCRGFASTLDWVWSELNTRYGQATAFDILYLSFQEAREGALRVPVSDLLFRPQRGLWQLSGYVLSRSGAQNLLNRLPVRGPIDLWINYQFQDLDVFATQRPIIEQRLDCPSTNNYSVLPVLSKVGLLTREKALLIKERALAGPVFAVGEHGSGLTALAMALSMLGYRCCSDITDLPEDEHEELFAKKRRRVFDAYVNIGSLSLYDYVELAKLYRHALFIITVKGDRNPPGHTGGPLDKATEHEPLLAYEDGTLHPSRLVLELRKISRRVLVLPVQHRDKWELLCGFLGRDYPTNRYPECEDQARRTLGRWDSDNDSRSTPQARRLKSDSSPWIAPRKDWHGLPLAEVGEAEHERPSKEVSERFEKFDRGLWKLRDDTFPSNMALFSPGNFSIGSDRVARLTLREEHTSVRKYTSASISSRQRHLYGRFAADLRPSDVPGLITGVFLHRNSPRQEIDIELLGRDTTKLLVNVYYNPGEEGTRLEYGYRGVPALIDLGFDASKDFHLYEIEWHAMFIRWRVDGRLVYERANWNPTPIPHLPMQFNVNLWHSRSQELAGKLAGGDLPAQSELRGIQIHASSVGAPAASPNTGRNL